MYKDVHRYHLEHVIIIFLFVLLVFLISLLTKNSSTQVKEGKFLIPTQLAQQESQQVLATHSSKIKNIR